MNIHTHPTRILLASLVAASFSAPSLAQSGDRAQGAPHAKGHHKVQIVNRDAIIGAHVVGSDDAELGKVTDLVIDARHGRTHFAVLECDGADGADKHVTKVAWKALQWDAKARRFSVAMTAEEIANSPEFTADSVEKLAVEAKAGREGPRAAEAKGDKPAITGDARKPASAVKPAMMLASNLGKVVVRAGADKVGTGNALFLEPKSGSVAFVTIAAMGLPGNNANDLVVPWSALQMVGSDVQLALPKGADKGRQALEGAPRISDQDADVSNPEFRRRVYEFYGVRTPAFDAMGKGHDTGSGGGGGDERG